MRAADAKSNLEKAKDDLAERTVELATAKLERDQLRREVSSGLCLTLTEGEEDERGVGPVDRFCNTNRV